MEEEALPEPVLSMVESTADDWLEIASQGLGPVGASQDVGSDTSSMISVVDEEVETSDTEDSDDEDIDLNADADSPNIFLPTEE